MRKPMLAAGWPGEKGEVKEAWGQLRRPVGTVGGIAACPWDRNHRREPATIKARIKTPIKATITGRERGPGAGAGFRSRARSSEERGWGRSREGA
ncbi:hypothetical protein GCM10010246_33600 [Streptomyces cuspidosporus]|uniref:Transposase n=1 Tax=Streptomyces cuspidosporus TaxID=66882 RepID=A0ABP5T4R0_9ACTN